MCSSDLAQTRTINSRADLTKTFNNILKKESLMLQRKQLFFSVLFLTAFVGTSSFSMAPQDKPTTKEKVLASGLGTYAAYSVLKFLVPFVNPVTAVVAATYVGYETTQGLLNVGRQNGTPANPYIPAARAQEEKKN